MTASNPSSIMSPQVTARGERLYIAGEMTIYGAAELYRELFDEARRHPRARWLDLSGVTEIDTAGLQILIMAKRHARAGCPELQSIDPSPAVLAVIELLQLPLHAPQASSAQADT